jgi:hypothetical protein
MFTDVCLGSVLGALCLECCRADDAADDADGLGWGSEGAPGLLPQYNPDFHAAFVRDPAGHELAAVCRGFTSRLPATSSPASPP